MALIFAFVRKIEKKEINDVCNMDMGSVFLPFCKWEKRTRKRQTIATNRFSSDYAHGSMTVIWRKQKIMKKNQNPYNMTADKRDTFAHVQELHEK